MSARAALALTALRALRLAAPAFAVLLAGCWFSSDKVAGGDDFPNSVETLGRTAAEESSDSTDWNVWKEAPATPPGVYDSTHVPQSEPEPEPEGLLRQSASGGIFLNPSAYVPGRDIPGAIRAVDTILPDPLLGERRTVRVQSAMLFTVRDTTWSALGPGGRREVRRVSGRLELAAGGYRAFSFEDDDGDSSLAPRAGGPSSSAARARIRIVEVDPAGREKQVLMRVAAGPDQDFSAPSDNLLLQLERVVRAGKDTLLKRLLRPADDDDTVIYDPGRDSNRVEVEQETRRDDGSVEQVFYESVVFPDSGRNYSKRYRSVLTTEAGVTETTLLGRDSLPDFAPGDTGRVRAVFESSVERDTLLRSETVYRVRLSDSTGRHEQNRLLRVDREKAFRFGRRAKLRYEMLPPEPLGDGGRPRAGDIVLRLDLRPSGWVEFTGVASPGGFVGTWLKSGGLSGVANFDSLGGHRSPVGP